MRRILMTTAAAVVAATALTIAPAQAASYSVTLATSKATADVGTRFTLSGKVTGKSSGGKTVTIQRKIGNGAWTKLTTATTSSKGAYSKKITVKSVGAKQYRVVAPKAGSVGSGSSIPVTVTGYTWLYLADQPTTSIASVVDTPRTIGGKTYKKSIVLVGQFVAWNLDEKCDSVTAAVTVDPYYSQDNPPATTVQAASGSGALASAIAQLGVVSPLSVNATGLSAFGYQIDNDDDSTAPVDILSPRAHCSVTQLPEYVLF